MVGSKDATRGIILAYDIFGVCPQTIQGADRLASETRAILLMPDFFSGKGLDHGLIPPDTEEKKNAMYAFFNEMANFEDNLPRLFAIRKAVSEMYPATEGRWGIFGLCWGGKLAVLACGEGNEGSDDLTSAALLIQGKLLSQSICNREGVYPKANQRQSFR